MQPVAPLHDWEHTDNVGCRGRVGVYATVSFKRNTVNPYSRLERGKLTAREAIGGAGKRSRKKRMPTCSGSDTSTGLTRKGADFRVVFLNERAFGIS
jgi:hypothetical protein